MSSVTTRSYLLTLRFISLFMAISIMIICIPFIILKLTNELSTKNEMMIYRYIPYFFSFIFIPISTYIFKRTIGMKIRNSLREKLFAYRSAHILRTSLLEASGIIAGAMLGISGDWIALIPAPLAIAFILINIPTPDRIIEELELEEKEAAMLHNPQSSLY